MSSFIAKKLDEREHVPDTQPMGQSTTSGGSRQFTHIIRRRIERGGERLWRFEDFRDLPSSAVAQALSRLTRQGLLQRLSKGVYYRSRQTTFGKSLPNPAAMQKLGVPQARIDHLVKTGDPALVARVVKELEGKK